ncbi:DUF2061 domain-containing protein [Candidatus Pelagibacter sp. HIMB1517]|uniref:DUF2061 domain-containing protein n=1 Tax=Candidatus Pelagibacter sp. HIMB1517 TaxID=3413341 RepID=UPI003F8491FB
MTEFRKGIFNVVAGTSFGRALIYTCGHVIIAMTVVSVLTGASLFEAGLVALVEPTINGFWYYLLDKLWTKTFIQKSV